MAIKIQPMPYQLKGYRTEYITEEYISSPPAAFIIAENGDSFTLGPIFKQYKDNPTGMYSFNILRNGADTGIFASLIEKRKGKVRVFTKSGWYYWNGTSFV